MPRIIELLGPSARLLIVLLNEEKFMRQLIRHEFNPDGIGGQDAVKNARNLLLQMNLITKYDGPETPRPRLYLRLTERGRTVAEHLKAIQDLLEQTP